MASLYDFSRHIADLKREKKYADALSFFKENKADFSNEQIANNEYLISDIISCLRYTNYFDAGFQFLKIYNIQINSDTKERILNAYGWLLWSKYKSENSTVSDIEEEHHFFEDDEEVNQEDNFHYDKSELIERIETLIPLLLELNNDFSKTLISNLFSIVLKSEKKKPAPNWKLVNDFCNHINPEVLSRECSTIQIERKGQMRDMELASDIENWYAYKTKALMKLGEWQECFEKSKEALVILESFHYSNDVWFSRRIALSKKNLGNTKDTIEELKHILRKKKEWFIQKELAELYFDENDLENAFKYAIQAITNFGHLEFKVDLLFLLGKILNKKDETDLAFKHFSLSKLIRQVEEWKIPQKVFDELRNFESVEININDIGKLKLELKKYWNGFSQEKKKSFSNTKGTQKGEIIRIINDNERGKDGFLKSNNKDFYFSLSSKFYLTGKVEIGTIVEFIVIPSKDGKKEQTRIKKIIK
ncbi:hypothetical protein Lupro_02980 [Lutibacter profundi]|uniref:CSD domain-containing protein n=1 Tax=Lutibacter profundi TaxID=1622118 RepID=A0A0X8G593_9FLAO|nr:hypothetical protein [Lutibacter profundi]AMC10280.1 hypothetical protein Lupro_02980 [Lutibacter profundi]